MIASADVRAAAAAVAAAATAAGWQFSVCRRGDGWVITEYDGCSVTIEPTATGIRIAGRGAWSSMSVTIPAGGDAGAAAQLVVSMTG